MNIGLSSACFYPEILTENCIKLIKDIGFSSGEVFLNSISEYEEDFIYGLNQERLKHNFNINSVHSFSSAFEPFLFELYSRRRQDMFKSFKKVCSAAKLLGARYYTFHGMRKTDFDSMDKKRIVNVYDELIYNALEEGVVLAQENVSWCMSSDIRFLELLKEKCKYPIKFTLDIKQSFRAGQDIRKYIDIMGRDMVNLHINDKDEKNLCLLPGRGAVNYEELFSSLKEIGYGGDMVIEVYRDNFNNYSELSEARDFLSKKYENG
ncbi:MAG: sugar phosphate isomerase/epimerase family protein [Clostridiaceae bacterium]